AFACSEADSSTLPVSANSPPFLLEPPKIEILDCYRKAHWSLFRTEDTFDILLGGSNHDPTLEHALLKYLNEYVILEGGDDEPFEPIPAQFYSPDSLEPELVTTIRARLEEREQAKLRRARKKSMRKSVSEEISRSAPSPQASPEAVEPCLSQAEQPQNVEDEQSTESLLSSEDKTELSNDGKDLSPLVSNLEAALDLKEINEELQLRRVCIFFLLLFTDFLSL
ncbi:hypothetical protein OESDEN_20753, partial [Oesophagostomum dentatum]